jgi:hypothetical protein
MRYLSYGIHDVMRRTPCCLLVFVLLISGCSVPNGVSHSESINEAEKRTDSAIRPGTYCRIDMAVPRDGSQPYLRYSGEVLETTGDEIVLANALEESRVDEGKPMRQAVPYLTNRGTKRIRRADIAAIRVYSESESNAADHSH